jgi:hypothetical protein
MTHINLVANFTAEIQFNCQLKAKMKIIHMVLWHTKSKEEKKIPFFFSFLFQIRWTKVDQVD